MGKKIISVILAAVLMLSFTACGKKAELTVNGTDIDNEITAYFKASAKEGEDYTRLVARYVAVNSEFHNHGLTVPRSTRAEISQDVNDIWHNFGTYYETLGVSKETIYKIQLSKAYEILLLEERYGEGGVSPVSEDEIKTYFRENYAAIRFVTGYFFEVTESGTVNMTDAEKAALAEKFNAAGSAVNGGTTFEEAVSLIGSAEVHSAVVNSAGNDNFPDGFWEEARKIEMNKCAVVTLGSYIFLVQRVNSEEGEYECYSQYRSNCLYEIKGEEFEQIIAAWTECYK